MEHFRVILGLFLVMYLGSVVNGQDADITVSKPVMVKPNSTVVLSCIGSRSDVMYYIQTRVMWSFVGVDGMVKPLTAGFYADEKSLYAKQLFTEEKRFKLEHRSDAGTYRFDLSLKDVRPSDDGTYTCNLVGENGLIHSKNTSITVVSPVKRLRIELIDSKGDIVADSYSFTEGSKAVEITPGEYKVKCMANGSNPAPSMTLTYNGDIKYVNQMNKKNDKGPGPTYDSHFMTSMMDLKSMGAAQLLLCEAGISRQFYDSRRAGIKLMVKINKPDFDCGNASFAVGDRYRDITCRLTPKAGDDIPSCEHVQWKFGEEGDPHKVGANQKYTPTNKQYNIMESTCKPVEGGIEVNLQLYAVGDVHFKTIFYISYGVGNDAKEQAIQIEQKETSSASLLTPVSVLSAIMMAVASRLVTRNL